MEPADTFAMAESSCSKALASWNIFWICDAWPGVAECLANGGAKARFLPIFGRDLEGVWTTVCGARSVSSPEDSAAGCARYEKAGSECPCGALIGAGEREPG